MRSRRAVCARSPCARAVVAAAALGWLLLALARSPGSARSATRHGARPGGGARAGAARCSRPRRGCGRCRRSRRCSEWSALAGCFPALAGRAGAGRSSRAALGALSYWWLALAETITGRRLLFGVAAGSRPRAGWQGSLGGAVDHALAPLLATAGCDGASLGARRGRAAVVRARAGSGVPRASARSSGRRALMVASVALAPHARRRPCPPLPLPAACSPPLLAFAAPSPAVASTSRGRRVAWRAQRRVAGRGPAPMSVLRTLETKIADLVEGAFGRAFRSEITPVELARRLVREMDRHRQSSLSSTVVPERVHRSGSRRPTAATSPRSRRA